jgi:hypothetical protein
MSSPTRKIRSTSREPRFAIVSILGTTTMMGLESVGISPGRRFHGSIKLTWNFGWTEDLAIAESLTRLQSLQEAPQTPDHSPRTSRVNASECWNSIRLLCPTGFVIHVLWFLICCLSEKFVILRIQNPRNETSFISKERFEITAQKEYIEFT